MKTNRVITSLVFLTAFVSFLAAQDTTDDSETLQSEMVVTAEKREESLVEVPATLTLINGAELERSGAESLEKAAFYIPNLYLSGFNAKRTSFPFIRGIGAGQGDPAVTTYIDGVPQLFADTNLIDLVDISRVEVLKGPQGTLYGRNTIGGLIHYISREPDNNFDFDVAATMGSHDYERQTVSVKGPIVKDKLFYSFSAARSLRDGYTFNSVLGEDVDSRDGIFGRFKLTYKPSASWEFRLNAHQQRDRDGGFVLFNVNALQQNPYQIQSDVTGKADRDVDSISLDATWRGSAIDFHAVVSFGGWEASEFSDIDFTPLPILTRQTLEDQDQTYAEFRVTSAEPLLLGSARVEWVAGVSLFESDFNHFSRNNINQGFILEETSAYRLEDNGFGVFGQANIGFGDNFELIVGARQVSETKDTSLQNISQLVPEPLNFTEGEFSDDFDQFLPRFGVNYHKDNWSVYGNVTKSYRSGGFNRNEASFGVLALPDFDIYRVEEELGWNYEIGTKASFADDRVYISAAVFHIDWEDRQLSVPSLAVPGRFYLDNVADSESDGVELEIVARVNEHWDISGGLGITNAKFGNYIDPNTGVDLVGRDLPNVPENTFNLVVDGHAVFFQKYNAFIRAEMVRYGDIYWDNANEISQPHYTMANLRTGIERGGFRFELWADNITETDYIAIAIPGIFGYAGANGFDRQTGITIGYRY